MSFGCDALRIAVSEINGIIPLISPFHIIRLLNIFEHVMCELFWLIWGNDHRVIGKLKNHAFDGLVRKS